MKLRRHKANDPKSIAADKGAKVICVEKGSAPCATRPTGMSWFGTKKLKELGVLCTEEEKAVIVKDIFGGANTTSKQDIVRLWLDESGEAGDYLTDIIEASGIPVRVGGYYGYYKHFDTVAEGAEDMKKTGGIYSDSYWNMYALQHQVGENEAPLSRTARPELEEEYPLICNTGCRIPVYFHSEHRQLPWCREQWPVPRMEIHPSDAEKYGIEQGDWVWIENENGKIRQVADIYAGIEPGVINCEHQWWYSELNQSGHGFELSGVNCLVSRDLRECASLAQRGQRSQLPVHPAQPRMER